MKRISIVLLLCLPFLMFSPSQAQELTRIEANFNWQLFEDVTVYKNGKIITYLSNFKTHSDGLLEGIFEGYYNKGWLTKQGQVYEFLAPQTLVWWVDTTEVGTDIIYLTDEDDMINIRAWPIVYDLETLDTISPDSVYYTQVKFPDKTKVKALAIKRNPSDDPLRTSCSNGTFISKDKEKEKKDKKDKEEIK